MNERPYSAFLLTCVGPQSFSLSLLMIFPFTIHIAIYTPMTSKFSNSFILSRYSWWFRSYKNIWVVWAVNIGLRSNVEKTMTILFSSIHLLYFPFLIDSPLLFVYKLYLWIQKLIRYIKTTRIRMQFVNRCNTMFWFLRGKIDKNVYLFTYLKCYWMTAKKTTIRILSCCLLFILHNYCATCWLLRNISS